jgi:hypothetical protein
VDGGVPPETGDLVRHGRSAGDLQKRSSSITNREVVRTFPHPIAPIYECTLSTYESTSDDAASFGYCPEITLLPLRSHYEERCAVHSNDLQTSDTLFVRKVTTNMPEGLRGVSAAS